MVNERVIAQAKDQIENPRNLPACLWDTGLSLGATHVLEIWLMSYQRGELPGVVQACGYSRMLDPKFVSAVRELISSGVMPDRYVTERQEDDEEVLYFAENRTSTPDAIVTDFSGEDILLSQTQKAMEENPDLIVKWGDRKTDENDPEAPWN